MNPNYQVRISHDLIDPAWDDFVAATPGGCHVQSSLWAQVKHASGWGATRVLVTQNDDLVAGAQILLRPAPGIGAVGYVPKGPLIATEDPTLAEIVTQWLRNAGRTSCAQYLVVQPPNNADWLARRLPGWGFEPGTIEVAYTATTTLDLTPSLDDILAAMKSKTRYNIRRGLRGDLKVREAGMEDLDTFYQLLAATGKRQHFVPYAREYFDNMWRVFDERGDIALFLVENEGEPVSALLALGFGDTVTYKKGGWSGKYGKQHPNEMMQWAAMQWAKSKGYSRYDFDGIRFDTAQAIMQNEPLPPDQQRSLTTFKLGFGGGVTLCPQPYDYIFNPLLRWVCTKTPFAPWAMVNKALSLIRTLR